LRTETKALFRQQLDAEDNLGTSPSNPGAPDRPAKPNAPPKA